MYEVGVHIADVSNFVEAGSALDMEAADRATSVYLVQKVGGFEGVAFYLKIIGCGLFVAGSSNVAQTVVRESLQP